MKNSLLAFAALTACLSFAAMADAEPKFELKADRRFLGPGEAAKFTLIKDGKASEEKYILTADAVDALECKAAVCTAKSHRGGLTLVGDVVVAATSTDGAATKLALTTITLVEGERVDDARDDLEATFFTGGSIDSFAAEDLNNYLNPGEASKQKGGYVAGADFGYRMIGNGGNSRKPQLWVYGETVHGQRSAEVDCAKDAQGKTPAQCSILDGFSSANPNAFLGILRNASSLEAYAGVRLDLLTLHPGGSSPAKLYLKSELGFFTISGAGGDLFDSHQKLGIGIAATNGKYRDSYLEVGWGKSDIYKKNPGNRFKVDGYLSWDLGGKDKWFTTHGMKPFLQMTMDSDFGKGADSVRTYYGFNFDLRLLFNPTATTSN